MTTNEQPSQQYQLKLAVIHHPSLKTVQLIEFLQNQSNQFLKNDLPQYLKGEEKFLNLLEYLPLQNTSLSTYDFDEYVGLVMIYSTSSEDSFNYLLPDLQTMLEKDIGDLFIIVVEMDNSQKHANLIGNAGERFCQKNNIQFVRLTLYNSQDLINVINKNLYELIENYYYPNQEPQIQPNTNKHLTPLTQKQQKQNHTIINGQGQINKDGQNSSFQYDKNSQYIFSYEQQTQSIKAYNQTFQPKIEKQQEMISHANSLRKSREQLDSLKQQNLDQSIENIQNILNNINHRIKQKLHSGWFTHVKNKLYSPAEKDNLNFSKIKLTQEFIDDPPKKTKKTSSLNPSIYQSRYSDVLNNSSKNFALNFNTLKFNVSSIKTPILRLVLFISKEKVVQLQVYQNSSYEELAVIALRRLEIRQTDKNIEKVIGKIKRRIETFSKQLYKAIKTYQDKKIKQRSFVKSKSNYDDQ